MQINENIPIIVEWATVSILRNGFASPWVGSPVVPMDSCQTGNGSMMGTDDVSMYIVGMVWKHEGGKGGMWICERKDVKTYSQMRMWKKGLLGVSFTMYLY